MNYLAQNLSFLIEKSTAGFSQVAKELDQPISTLKKWVNKGKEPGASDLIKLSRYFEVSVDTLLKKDLSVTQHFHQSRAVKFLVLDVDGVLTDGGMYYTEEGKEIKKYNTKDGMAIKELIKSGVKAGFISSGFNPQIVEQRAELLGVNNVYVGRAQKLEVLQEWVEKHEVTFPEVAFVGDDVNDIAVMEKVGLSACPADAVPRVKETAQVLLSKKGGRGCVREFVDHYIQSIY